MATDGNGQRPGAGHDVDQNGRESGGEAKRVMHTVALPVVIGAGLMVAEPVATANEQ